MDRLIIQNQLISGTITNFVVNLDLNPEYPRKKASLIVKSPYIVEVTSNEGPLIVHNPGLKCIGLKSINRPVLISSLRASPTSRLSSHVLEAVWSTQWVGVNPHRANELFYYSLKKGFLKSIPIFSNIESIKPEYVVEGSRFDFLIHRANDIPLIIQVKNVNWNNHGAGLFPAEVKGKKTISPRAVKHLTLLNTITTYKPVLIFIVQRTDIDRVGINSLDSLFNVPIDRIDKYCFNFQITEQGWFFEKIIPFND